MRKIIGVAACFLALACSRGALADNMVHKVPLKHLKIVANKPARSLVLSGCAQASASSNGENGPVGAIGPVTVKIAKGTNAVPTRASYSPVAEKPLSPELASA